MLFQPLKENKFRLKKSRYGTVDMYLSQDGEKYNDCEVHFDEAIFKQLCDAGEFNPIKWDINRTNQKIIILHAIIKRLW